MFSLKNFMRLLFLVLALSLLAFNAPAADLPAPVPGLPVGWCIRAQTNAFMQAASAHFEYVELALQDVLGLSDEEFSKLGADLQRLNLRALSGYNSVPKELKIVGPDVDQAKLNQHLDHLLSRAAAL